MVHFMNRRKRKRKGSKKRKRTFKLRKSSSKRRKVSKRTNRSLVATGSNVRRPKDKLHGGWKKAFWFAYKVAPFQGKTVNGAPIDREWVQKVLGDPKHHHRVITNLHSNGRAVLGHATNAGVQFFIEMTNVNDPFDDLDNNHPLYHAEWVAEGYGRVCPLACTYKFRITTLTQDDKDEFILFWRVQNDESNIPSTAVNGATALKAMQDMLANKEWYSKRFWGSANRSGGQKDFVTFAVTVPNIPKHIRRTNAIANLDSGTAFEYNFADVTTSMAVNKLPTLQCVIWKADGNGIGNTAEFRMEMSSDHTVLLWRDDSAVTDPVADEHA